MHRDAVEAGERVLIVDDVIATGGTAAACAQLAESCGGIVDGFGFDGSSVRGWKSIDQSDMQVIPDPATA